MLQTTFIGDAPLRVRDDMIDRPCWELRRHARGVVLAQILEAEPGQFELWHEGYMWDGASVAECVRKFSTARDIIPADKIHALALRGDGLEVSPVREEDGSCEVCEENEATMWSVYIHRDGQGVQCVADWDQPEQAELHARELLASYPNLAAHGINNSNSRQSCPPRRQAGRRG